MPRIMMTYEHMEELANKVADHKGINTREMADIIDEAQWLFTENERLRAEVERLKNPWGGHDRECLSGACHCERGEGSG